jgi:Zn-dependent oligopeptidase
MRIDLYHVFKQVKENDKIADPESARYLDKLIEELELNGMKFDDARRQKITALKKEIEVLSDRAHSNISEDKSKVKVTLEELKGMPADILKKLKPVPGQPNMRFVSMSKTEVIPALKNVEDEKVRKML